MVKRPNRCLLEREAGVPPGKGIQMNVRTLRLTVQHSYVQMEEIKCGFSSFFYIKHDGDLCCVNRRRQLLLFCQQRQLNNVWLQTNKNAAKPNLMRCIGQRVSSAHRPHQFYILFVFAFLPEKLNVHYFQSAIFLSDFQIHCPEKGLICASRK